MFPASIPVYFPCKTGANPKKSKPVWSPRLRLVCSMLYVACSSFSFIPWWETLVRVSWRIDISSSLIFRGAYSGAGEGGVIMPWIITLFTDTAWLCCNAGLLSGQRRRRCPNNKPTLNQLLILGGKCFISVFLLIFSERSWEVSQQSNKCRK